MSTKNDHSNRISALEQSNITAHALKHPVNTKALKEFEALLAKCYGHFSRNIVIQNEQSGIVAATSASEMLFRVLTIDNPLVRLVTTASLAHLNKVSDGGLFTSILALSLLHTALQHDNINRHLIANLYEKLLEESMLYLRQDDCMAKCKIDLSTTEMLLKLAKSVITSKPGCVVSNDEADQISRLVVTAFIKSPTIGKGMPNLHVIPMQGHYNIMRSEVKDGFLYATPEYDIDDIDSESCEKNVECKRINGEIRSIIIATSMAGDSEDYTDGKYEFGYRTKERLSKNKMVLEHFRHWIEKIIKLGVGLLLCQKVIHEDLKAILKRNNVIVLDRLGSKGIKSVHSLTGGTFLQSHHKAIDINDCGLVKSIKQIEISNKIYFQLQGDDTICTLILYHYSEEALDELKLTCEQAYDVLQQSLSHPYVLYGGGCWLTCLAGWIESNVKSYISNWSKEFECNPLHISPVIHAYTLSLRSVASLIRSDRLHYVDDQYHHHWMIPDYQPNPEEDARCVCGAVAWKRDMLFTLFEEMIQSENSLVAKMNNSPEWKGLKSIANGQNANIFDGFTAITNGLHVAVECANMLLSLSIIISDKN